MEKQRKLGIFLFRRDMRLEDNTALLVANSECKEVIPVFIFDERQVGEKNAYRSANAIQFMIESLDELDDQLKKRGGRLYTFYGIAHEVLEHLLQKVSVDAVYCNVDYTPFSARRDGALERVCAQLNVDFFTYHDVLLHAPGKVMTKGGEPYSVFTPFYKAAVSLDVDRPEQHRFSNFYTKEITLAHQKEDVRNFVWERSVEPNNQLFAQGGRKAAQKILRNLGQFKDYSKTRDFPFIETTGLSAHNKFGTVSIREVYYAMKERLGLKHEPLTRQLYWRDFFYHVAYFNPQVFGHAFHEHYDALPWKNNKKDFQRWCKGTTGFPIVDAGMRQLNATGYMHNRVRMIVASFLTKDLHISWLWGEKYFAQRLVDYDPCVNNGSWQWAASTGCDSQPYFRIFNPWLQQKKFDPECEYIKTWIPELQDVPNKVIHGWETSTIQLQEYPRPMVDHSVERDSTLKLFKSMK